MTGKSQTTNWRDDPLENTPIVRGYQPKPQNDTTVGEFYDITLERVRELAPEAFREAVKRYPDDVEGALLFFGIAIGLSIAKPTEADIAWGVEVMKRHGR